MSTAVPNKAVVDAFFWSVVEWTAEIDSVAGWLGNALTAICVVQCINYFRGSYGDPLYIKAMALASTALQVAASVLEITGHLQQVRHAVTQTVTPNALLPSTVPFMLMVYCFSGLVAQAYYFQLIRRMLQTSTSSRRKWYVWTGTIVFGLMWCTVLALGILVVVSFSQVPTRYWVPQFDTIILTTTPHVAYVGRLTSTAALDLVLSVILVTHFTRGARKDGFQQTKSLLTALAISTLETFALTSTLAIADMALGAAYYLVSPLMGAKIIAACYMLNVMESRAYCASLLYTLSRRAELRARLDSGRHPLPSGGGNARDKLSDPDESGESAGRPSHRLALRLSGPTAVSSDSSGVRVETYTESTTDEDAEKQTGPLNDVSAEDEVSAGRSRPRREW